MQPSLRSGDLYVLVDNFALRQKIDERPSLKSRLHHKGTVCMLIAAAGNNLLVMCDDDVGFVYLSLLSPV